MCNSSFVLHNKTVLLAYDNKQNAVQWTDVQCTDVQYFKYMGFLLLDNSASVSDLKLLGTLAVKHETT